MMVELSGMARFGTKRTRMIPLVLKQPSDSMPCFLFLPYGCCVLADVRAVWEPDAAMPYLQGTCHFTLEVVLLV